jgi:hypothetical protein
MMMVEQEANVHRERSSPKDVFLHLLLIITLYMSVGSFIALIFQVINLWIPDPLISGLRAAAQGSIRWSTSILVVAFPVFMWLSVLLEREFGRAPGKRSLMIRKWLLYLTLFLAAIVIITDLMVLVFNFYGGELTLPFALKILTVLAVAAVLFGYYLWEVRREATLPSLLPKKMAWGVSAVVVMMLIVGFVLVGSPVQQRKVRFDQQRVADLTMIQDQVVHFWTLKQRLPETLEELTDSLSGFVTPRDPVSGQPYEYRRGEGLTFELCATFEAEGDTDPTSVPRLARPEMVVGDFFASNYHWQHGVGRTCFERTIDPQLYRPQPLPKE